MQLWKKKALPCIAISGPLCEISEAVAGNPSAKSSENSQDRDSCRLAESMELLLLFLKVFFMLLRASGSSVLPLALPLWGAEQSGQHWLTKGTQQPEVFHPGLFLVAPGFI